MEEIDFIDSGIAGFLGRPRGSHANTRVEMTKPYRLPLDDRFAKVCRFEKKIRRSLAGLARLIYSCRTSSSRPAVPLLRRTAKIAEVVDRTVDVRTGFDCH
jgi:hypothetical protein